MGVPSGKHESVATEFFFAYKHYKLCRNSSQYFAVRAKYFVVAVAVM